MRSHRHVYIGAEPIIAEIDKLDIAEGRSSQSENAFYEVAYSGMDIAIIRPQAGHLGGNTDKRNSLRRWCSTAKGLYGQPKTISCTPDKNIRVGCRGLRNRVLLLCSKCKEHQRFNDAVTRSVAMRIKRKLGPETKTHLAF